MPSSLRRALVTCVALLSAVAVVACDPGDDEAAVEERPAPPPRADLVAPTAEQLADGIELGSMQGAALNGAAVVEETVVLVGSREEANGLRPIVLVSDDGGASFAAGELDADVPWIRLEQVAGGRDGWLASGWDGGDVPALWRSADGREWERVPAEDLPWTRTDGLDRLRYVDGRFVALGTSEEEDDADLGPVRVWTSADGSAWSAASFGDADAGDHRPVGAVVEGDGALTAVVEVEDATIEEQPSRIEVWRSSDGGRSFAREETPLDLGGARRVYANDVTVRDGRVQVALQTGSADPLDDTWAGGVLRRTDTGWDVIEARAWSDPSHDDRLVTLASAADSHIAAGGRRVDGQRDAFLTVGGALRHSAPLEHPLLVGSGDQDVSQLLRTREGVLVVGSTSRSGTAEPFVLLVSGGRVSEVELPALPADGRVGVDVEAFVPVADGPIVVGQAAGSPAVWTQDGAGWVAEGLPRPDDDRWAEVSTAVQVGDTVVAVGQSGRRHGSGGAVWTRSAEGAWRVRAPSPLHPNGSGYGTTTLSDLAVVEDDDGSTLVVVGSARVNGQQQAFVARSVDGGRWWTRGTTGALRDATDEDTWQGHLPDAGFAAPPGGTVAVTTVAATPGGWIAAGSRSAPGGGTHAVFWESEDGVRWSDPRELTTPIPAGGAEDDDVTAGVSRVLVRGAEVVLQGWVGAGPGRSGGWVTWRRDAEGGWDTGPVVGDLTDDPGADVSAADLVALPDGWLAVGSTGAAGNTSGAAWTSADGLAWDAIVLDAELPGTDGAQTYLAAHVDGDRLVLLASDVRTDDGGVGVFDTPVPSVATP
ncbi:MAG TPA: hypothetical protein VGE77_13270 [Nocardioides sp.]